MAEQSPQLPSVWRPFAEWVKDQIEQAFRQRGIGTRFVSAGSVRGELSSAVSLPHDILSSEHTDSDSADVPADGDVLTYRTDRWVAEQPAPGGGSGVEKIVTAPTADGWEIVFTEDGEIVVTA